MSTQAPAVTDNSDPVSRLPQDKVEISREALQAARGLEGDEQGSGLGRAQSGEETPGTEPKNGGPVELTPEEQAQVQELQQRDREVRAHENAHLAAGGSAVQGGPTFTYRTGPDGRRYATGGEVSIQLRSNSDDPQERIRHAKQVRRAALSPGEPSPHDRAVAADAGQKIARAQADLRIQETEQVEGHATNANSVGALFNRPPSAKGSKIDVAG